MTLISVCVATYRRPDGLRELLESLEAQELDESVRLEILVVDNDPPSAETVVQEHGDRSRHSVRYFTQPEPNISLTRNVAVAAAEGDLIWFVDDDEIAEPLCGQRLLDAMHDFDADVVFGPVLPRFEAPLADWLRPLYERPVHATGNPSEAHRTGNTLVKAPALELVDGPFDAEYGVTGGSDGLLFRQLEAAGLRLIDSADACVSEVVPADRATWEWLRQRMRRQGQNWARQTVTLSGGVATPETMAMSAKAVVQLVLWSGAALVSWRNPTERGRYLMRLWTNVGKLEGVAGVTSRRDG